MIDYAKYQQDIVKSLLSSGRIGYQISENGDIYVSKNGYDGISLKANQVVFSLDRCREVETMTELFAKKESDVLCKPTRTFERDPFSRIVIQKWKSEKFDIWFNENYLKDIGSPSVLYASSPTDRALLLDGGKEPLAILLPVRHAEAD